MDGTRTVLGYSLGIPKMLFWDTILVTFSRALKKNLFSINTPFKSGNCTCVPSQVSPFLTGGWGADRQFPSTLGKAHVVEA